MTGRRTPSVKRQDDLTAKRVARAWAMIADGMSPTVAAKKVGLGNTKPLYPLPRPEFEIRADLERQLQNTYHKFWSDVRMARLAS